MDEDTVHMWTAECLEPIKDHVSLTLLLPVMRKSCGLSHRPISQG